MKRTHIYLSETSDAELDRLAAATDRPKAEHIRTAIAQYLRKREIIEQLALVAAESKGDDDGRSQGQA